MTSTSKRAGGSFAICKRASPITIGVSAAQRDEESEFGGVARDIGHDRVDFEDRPVLPGFAIAGQGARPQADDADGGIRPGEFGQPVERQADPRLMAIIGSRIEFVAGRRALEPVQRRAMREPPLLMIAIVGDGVDAEIAAHPHPVAPLFERLDAPNPSIKRKSTVT